MQNSRAFYKSAKRSSRLTSLTEDLSGADPPYREKLHILFAQIESTLDALYAENLSLQEKLEAVYAKGADATNVAQGQGDESLGTDTGSSKSFKSKLASSGSKLKTSYKIKAQTSKIVSSFKAHSVVSTAIREYVGHKDGLWSIATKIGQPIIGTSSADHTACIWGIESGKCLLQYQGHNGSVNSIRFHPAQDLVLTGSGDGTAHVWQGAVNYDKSVKKSVQSSDDELTEADQNVEDERVDTLRTPVCELAGHASVVVAADWLPGGDQIITASWDRTAILWNVETKEPVQTLTGHDCELTYCSVHPSQRLVVTVSRDSTFRLWDFRQEIPAVSVFQGHTESVTSAVLTKDDKVVSGSDDRSVKVWELRNMRSALTHIRTESAVNRLAVSTNSVIAIPLDNRDVRLFDINGQRIARLSRTNRQGHSRMVSCVAWSEDPTSVINLYSAGFDKKAIGWNVCLPKENN